MTTFREKINAALLAKTECGYVEKIFDRSRRDRIGQASNLFPIVLTSENFHQYRAETKVTEALFTCWGFPERLLYDPDNFPALRVVLHSGGSVKSFARPLLERGIQVMGAREANALVVAQFCLAQIILSCKGYFRNVRQSSHPETAGQSTAFIGTGLYGETIALLGMGAVARKLALLLPQFDLKILAVDPYMTKAEADKLGVKLVTLEQAFARAYVVSNHLPDLPQLSGVLNRPLFSSMRRDATFINTGRGAQVNETDLIDVARERPDITSLLDVTTIEPPLPGSPFYQLPNVQMSSHIAGAMNGDLKRMGDFVVGEFERYVQGQPLRHADPLHILDRLA